MFIVLVTVGLLALMVYALVQSRNSRFVAAVLLLLCTAGLTFTWFPSLAQDAASAMGVGRGVDLIIYLWILCSVFMSFNLHFRLRREHESFTRLVSSLAIQGARQPEER